MAIALGSELRAIATISGIGAFQWEITPKNAINVVRPGLYWLIFANSTRSSENLTG